MYDIGICDDGKYVCSLLEEMLLDYAQKNNVKLEISVWYTGEVLCDYLQKGNRLDLLFLDIELTKQSGVQVAEYIRNQLEERQMQIVYISGKSSYAQQLFKTQPMDFLIKPITREQIEEVMTLALKILGTNRQIFSFRNGREYYQIPYGEILYFVSEGRKIKIVLHQGELEFYGKLKDIEGNLFNKFLRIHQSYLVNKTFIVRYTYETVELITGIVLPISKTNRKKVRAYLLQGE